MAAMHAIALFGCGSRSVRDEHPSAVPSPSDAGASADAAATSHDSATIEAAVTDASGTDTDAGWTWQSVNLQGMGYPTGLVIHPNTSLAPNRVYARTDVGGAYRYDKGSATWRPMLDSFGPSEAYAYGVESIAIDPSVADDVYVALNGSSSTTTGQVLCSHDEGAHWSSTGALGATMHSNSAYRGSTGERLAVDPRESGLLYFGSRDDGLWRQEPGGSWAAVAAGLPSAGDPGYTFVVFDPTSSLLGGATSRLLVGVYGSGVYESSDAGSSFSRVSSMANPTRAAIASDGVVYVSFGGSEGTHGPGAVQSFSGGSWSDITPPAGAGASYSGISIDRSDPAIVMVTTNSAGVFRSTNRGAKWSAASLTFEGVPKYVWESTWYVWGSAALVIDPNDTSGNTVWRTDGWGVSRTTDLGSGVWSPVMHGFEELVGTVLRVPPVSGGAQVIVGADDAMGFAIADRTTPPTRKLDPTQTDVSIITSLDYCATSPSNVAFVGWDEVDASASLTGLSIDDGQSFVPFADVSPGRGGVIAISASNPKNLVWVPTGGASIVYSTNGGISWQKAAGLPGASYYQSDAWFTGQSLAADRVDGNRFYFLSSLGDAVQLWTSTNGGATFSTSSSAALVGAPAQTQNPRIKPNPFAEGDVWITLGGDAAPLYRSVDGGASVEVVSGVDRAHVAGFGKGASSTVPALYLLGRVDGASTEAMFRSLDLGGSWDQVSDPTTEAFGLATDIEADLLQTDTVYVALGGRGFMYGGRGSP